MTVAWVIGRGGLLGAALARALAREGKVLFVPRQAFTWRDAEALADEVRRQTAAFISAVRPGDDWQVYWAAGIGTMGSDRAAFVPETLALETLLDALRQSDMDNARGRLALASSAGAIYAGSMSPVIDERTADAPTTPYAHAKLAHEQLTREYSTRCGVPVLISRISTLYGTGQASEKQQGLLTHISRCLIRNKPVHIFVPLDTIRDYVSADDAASLTIQSLESLAEPVALMKIVASERPATISEILSIFKRLARRPPRIVTSGTVTSSVYKRRIQFRSVVPPLRTREPMNLLLGISQILAAERRRYETAGRFVA